jgi:hypothetical protein
MTQVLLGFGGGILLGLRWKFAVLYPATLVVVVFMIGTEGLNWPNACLIVLVITAVQAGYICGVAVRELTRCLPSADRSNVLPGEDRPSAKRWPWRAVLHARPPPAIERCSAPD